MGKKKCCYKPNFTHVVTKQKFPVQKRETNNTGCGAKYVTRYEEHEIVVIYCTNCGTKKEQ